MSTDAMRLALEALQAEEARSKEAERDAGSVPGERPVERLAGSRFEGTDQHSGRASAPA